MRRWGWLFLGPVTAAFCIGFVWPFIQGIYLSFCKFKLISKTTWVGFDNYVSALKDASFMHSFWYTALFAIVSLVFINVLGFAAAYALTQGIRGSNLYRTVFFMPNLIGGIVLGYIWSMIFDGILSRYGTSILLESKYGFWGLLILMCWHQTLFRVTIPNVMPSITICTFLSLTNGFKLFDQNLALTAGQPFIIQPDGSTIKTTEMMALNIYNTFYGQNSASKGVGQAKAVLFFILVAGLGLAQLSYTRKREVQQ